METTPVLAHEFHTYLKRFDVGLSVGVQQLANRVKMPSKRGREDEDENEYEVEVPQKRRGSARRTDYLVKWK